MVHRLLTKHAAIRRCLIVFSCVVALLLATKVSAQIAGSGTIQGTITDASGALVANANVSLIETSTSVKRETKTDSAGIYIFPNVPVTTYNLIVAAPSFETYEQTGIDLEVGSSIAINVALKVGRADVKIEVQAEGIALQTEDVSFKQTIDEHAVTEMPLNGRQLESLLVLAGGTSAAPCGDCTGSKFPDQAGTVYAIGGPGGNTSEWKLDGGDANDYQTGANLDVPFPDAVAEFSVESSALGAVGGMHSGGLVNIVTKSGTNSYHGSAFEFVRNNYLDATSFFSSTKDTLHENQYGGSFGGKILRDKLFAFAAYQHENLKQSTTSSAEYLPTTVGGTTGTGNLGGDFSATDPITTPTGTAPACGKFGQLCDPLTGAIIPNNIYGSAPGGPTLVKNAAAVALLAHLPLPTPSGSFSNPNAGEVAYQVPAFTFTNEFITRVDYLINQKNSFYSRYFIDGYQFPAFYYPGGSASNGGILITTVSGNSERMQSFTMGENWTVNPNTVNSAHVSGTRERNDRGYNSADINAASIGVTDPQIVPAGLQLTVSSGVSNAGAFSMGGGSNALAVINVNAFNFSDDLTLVRGKHLFVIGGEFVRSQLNLNNAYNGNGSFAFNGQYSEFGPGGGSVVSGQGNGTLDFLEGALTSLGQSKSQQNANRGNIPSLYVSDTFHASKRLTLLGGVRWSPFFYPDDYFHRVAVFSQAGFESNKISSVYPNAPPGISFYGDPGVNGGGTLNSPWQWDANVGATYDLFGDGKTVVRGGLAQVYEQPDMFVGQRTQQNAPFSTATNPATSQMLCFSNPWLINGTSGHGCNQTGGTVVDPFPQAQVPTAATALFPAQSQWIVLQTQYQPQNSLQWTFSVQHEFPRGWQASIIYNGVKVRHTLIGLPLSPAVFIPGVWGAGGTGCTGIVTTGPAAVKPGAAGTNCSTTSNEISRYALTIANPIGNGTPVGVSGGAGTNGGGNQFGGGGNGSSSSILEANVGYDNYNGMIASLQHRLSTTFSFLINYTYSKCLNIVDTQGDISATQVENPYNIRQDYGRCGSDIRNMVNSNLVLKSAFPLHGAAAYLANNWELAPIFRITSGTPINVTAGGDYSLTQMGADRPNQLPGVNPYNFATIRKPPAGATTAQKYADESYISQTAYANVCTSTTAVGCAALGTFGNTGRNSLNGPMFWQFDSQVSRIFPIKEKVSLDLRIEAFNVLNHPSFANPSSSSPPNPGAATTSFGSITGTTGGVGGLAARVFQGGLKVIF
jgi:hypothetical protein